MACMTVFTPAMATMELKRATCRAVCIPWPGQQKSQDRTLRMSWVVVTDENGKRHLRSQWKVVNEPSN